MAEKELDITPIDEIGQDEPDEEEDLQSGIPSHLREHPCGLPMILMDRKELTDYERAHGMTVEDRNTLKGQMTKVERDLYEVYSGEMKTKRVTKEHFVTALRLWKDGCVVHPKRSRVLNDMKVLKP